MDKINALAEMLIAARQNHQAIDSVPDELVPVDLAEAALVDDRVAELSGWTVLGWKIGATSAAAREILGAPEPFAGRVYSILRSGAVLSSDDVLGEPRIEGEFAFTLGADLGPAACDRAAVAAAIANVCPAIEVVGGRYANMFGVPLSCLAADAGTNGLLVLGDPAEGVDYETLPNATATMTANGEVIGQGTGADVHGGPLNALCWLVDHLAARGIGLRAGQVVTTGTATQLGDFPAGSTAVADLAGVGSVSVSRSS